MTELEQTLETHRHWSEENLLDPSLPYLLFTEQNHLFYHIYSRLFTNAYAAAVIRRTGRGRNND